jgi:hypothetical protein
MRYPSTTESVIGAVSPNGTIRANSA